MHRIAPLNSFTRIIVQAVFVALVLSGCQGESSIDNLATVSAEEIDAIRRSQHVDITPEQVAETFSFGGSATDVQRQRLTEALIGGIVEWSLKVYEVSLQDGVYRLVSEPLRSPSDQSITLLSAVVIISPTDEGAAQVMESVRHGDSVRVRGRVKNILMRSILVVEPAVLVHPPSAGEKEK